MVYYTSMPKYRDYCRDMMSQHEALFSEFAQIHDAYKKNQSQYQEEFNRVGDKVLEIIREWESRLCGKSERGGKAVFSASLADKFNQEIKAFFPLIDMVGVKLSKPIKVKVGNKAPQLPKKDPDIDEIQKFTPFTKDTFVLKKIF